MRQIYSLLFLSLIATSLNAQELKVQRTTLDCGQVAFRTPTIAEFNAQNTGDKPLIITGAHPSCGCTKVEYPQQAIKPNENFKITVIYDANTLGHFEKFVELTSNNPEGTTELWIKGQVVTEITSYQGDYPYTLGLLQSEQTSIEFEDVNIGDQPKTFFHIYNPTNRTAEPYMMHLPSYLRANISPSKLKPGQAALVTMTLDSRSVRDYGLTQTNVYLAFTPGDKVSPETSIPVSVVLLPNFSKMNDTERALAPKAEVSEYTLDFSQSESKSPKEKVTITNHGRLPLVISNVQMSTEGIHLSLSSTTLQPGESATLTVKADKKVLARVKNKPRILMVTNDPEKPKIEIKLKM